jgi:dienelactone hydrolase
MTAPEPQAVGLAVLDLARAGRFGEIRDRFVAPLRPMVVADTLAHAWDTELAALGPVTGVGTPATEDLGGRAVLVRIPVRFERGERALQVTVVPTGELAGLLIGPAEVEAWQPPPYAHPDRFHEQELTLDADGVEVPATLTLPTTGGPFPALVLLAGSGPNDRDETVLAAKPFKDLAWGLAGRGVAVLRFDKVTFAHPERARSNPAFTVADEYVPHAVAGIRLLCAHPGVDAERIHVAGHSLGGTVAPRVAAAEPGVAGLVLLAAGSQPLHWAAVRQLRYLSSLDPATAAAQQPVVDAITAQAERVDSPDLSPDTPADQLPFGTPAPYWLDLRGYDPVGTAAALDRPVLLCQGGRDYQATVTDDLARWRAGLDGRPDVTVRVYPADNHFFVPGTGPSTPTELATAQHVDPQLVDDIADWLAAHTPTAGAGVPHRPPGPLS